MPKKKSLIPTTGLPRHARLEAKGRLGSEVARITEEARRAYTDQEETRAAWALKITEAIYGTVTADRMDEDITWSVDTSLECNILANRLNHELGPWASEHSDLTWVEVTPTQLGAVKTIRDFLTLMYRHLV